MVDVVHGAGTSGVEVMRGPGVKTGVLSRFGRAASVRVGTDAEQGCGLAESQVVNDERLEALFGP